MGLRGIHKTKSYDYRLKLAAGLTLLMFVAELVGGIISHSLALMSDAGHMLTDLLAMLTGLFAFWFSRRPSDSKRTYGYFRLEILAAVINSLLLLGVVVYILWEAVERLQNPQSVQIDLVIGIGFIGLLVNLVSLSILHGGTQNLNLRGVFLHVLGDTLSSIGVILTVIVMRMTHWYLLDAVISFAIAFIILYGALLLLKESLNILMEASPKSINLDQLSQALNNLDGVNDVHDLHVWSISSDIHAMSAHLLVGDHLDREQILKEVQQLLKVNFQVDHSTIQIESEDCGLRC